MVLYQDDRFENYYFRYTYTFDRWNNTEKVYVKPAHSDYGAPWETMFLTSEETFVQEEAEERIIEYFRAMLYREPTADELALYLADWEKTGFTNFAREIIRQSDEYKNGNFTTFVQQAENLRNSRIAGLQSAFTIAKLSKQTLLDGLNSIVTQVSADYQALQTTYESRKDDNDKKYIKEIYRNILGREGIEDEINMELAYMRANNKTLEDMRARVQAYSEYTDRKAAIQNIIKALYDTANDTGLLKDYLNAEDKYDYITNTLGYVVNREFLHNITSEQIQAIISWLETQDNHFGRSAVQALYKQLDSAGIQDLPNTDSLLKELIFLDIVTGVITEDTQGLLLVSMHAIKKVAKAYGLDLYGTAYDVDEFLSKFDEIPGYSAIAHYNNNHFINVTGVVKDGDTITHVIITNGYINGVEQTKTIKIDEFRENFEGKILSVEKSDYDKRLTDDQLKNIKGAGWLSKYWKKIKKIFKKIFRALKTILKYIIEPIKQFINAIKFAIEQGKWGRVFGAIYLMVSAVALCFVPGMQTFAYTIMSTALSMATAICYGEYGLALKSFAIGVATAILQYAAQVITSVVKSIMTELTKVKDVFISIKNTAVNMWTTAVKEAGNFANKAWLFAKNTVLGFTTTGVSRYFTEEINKNASWGAKIGYAFAGAYALTGISALTNSNFGANWCTGTTSIHIMTELAFGAMSMIASTEIYKALEDEWEEEWYRDFMFASINTMVGVGFSIVKGAVHQAIGDYPMTLSREDIARLEDKVEKIREDNPGKHIKSDYTRKRFEVWSNNKLEKEIIYHNGKFIEIDHLSGDKANVGGLEFGYDHDNKKLFREKTNSSGEQYISEEIYLSAIGTVDRVEAIDEEGRKVIIDYHDSLGHITDIKIEAGLAEEVWKEQFGGAWSEVLAKVDMTGMINLDDVEDVLKTYLVPTTDDLSNTQIEFVYDSLIRLNGETKDPGILRFLDQKLLSERWYKPYKDWYDKGIDVGYQADLSMIFDIRGNPYGGFSLNTDFSMYGLKYTNSANLFFHGFWNDRTEAKDFMNDFLTAFEGFSYYQPSALISWPGDTPNFNKAIRSANISWPGVKTAVNYMHGFNPAMRMNAVTFSLGARELLNAAKNGVKFGTVVMFVPAIDNESICVGGEFEGALRNIDNLVVVYSNNQRWVFGEEKYNILGMPDQKIGAYQLFRFDRALGQTGPSGSVPHLNYVGIDATSADNIWGVQIDDHGDLYDYNTIMMLFYYLTDGR